MSRPSFHSLTPEEQAQFGNGVGPWWMPDWMRQLITGAASWFFQTASWRHHDFGYAVGGDRYDRRRCDDKFLLAMLYDAVMQDGYFWLVKLIPAIIIAILFYLAVRIGGQFGSFQYSDQYASAAEVLKAARR